MEPHVLKIKSSTFLSYAVLIYVFLAPLFVCTILITSGMLNILNILLLVYMVLFILLYKVSSVKLNIPIVLFWAPFLISILSASLNLAFINDPAYYEYYLKQMPIRLINCLVFFLFYVLSFMFLIDCKNWNFNKVIKSYLFGIVIFLILFGCWQLLHMFFGIWIPDIQTRSYIHSLSQKIDIGSFIRITSLADEPSYLVPFLIDGIILSCYFKKYYLAIVCVILVFFSISLGGYVNFLLLVILVTFLKRKVLFKRKFILALTLSISALFLIILILPDVFDPLFNIISDRKEISDGSYSESVRGETVIKPWGYLFEGTPWSIIAGNGPSSMKYLNATKVLSDGEAFHVTSNNIVTDYVFETGLLGLLFLFLFFAYLIRNSFDKTSKQNRNSFYAKLLVVHLFITSLYRADYISPRFWILTLIIIYLQTLIKNGDSYNSNISTS